MIPESPKLATEPQITRHPWDTKSWLIGGIGGALGVGMLMVAMVYDPESDTYGTFGFSGVILALMVVPMVLAGIANRRWLLWPFLPLATGFITCIASIAINPSIGGSGPAPSMGPNDYVIMASLLALPFVSALPIAAIRLHRIKRRRQLYAVKTDDLPSETAERAWPPPPTDGD